MKHLTVIASLFFLMASFAMAGDQKLKIAATEYPPYYGASLDGNGFISEIVVEAFSRGGYEVEIDFLPWKRAIESAKQGKHDGLFTVWYRAEREEWFLFSDPLPANELVFFKRKDDDISYQGFDSLKAHMIGVVRGYAPPSGFTEAGLKTSEAKDDTENLRKLHKGRVDLVLADKVLATHIIATQIPNAAAELEWVEPVVEVATQYLVVSRNAPDSATILEKFNAGLDAMTEDGTLASIVKRHGFGG